MISYSVVKPACVRLTLVY